MVLCSSVCLRAIRRPFPPQKSIEPQRINAGISKVAIDEVSRHPWYLSVHKVGLGFFDSNVSNDKNMDQALSEHKVDGELLKRKHITKIENVVHMELSDFESSITHKLFRLLGIDSVFLKISPEKWTQEHSFQHGLKITKNLKVVNDNAERGEAIIEAYSRSITQYEDQKQFLLQVVQDHRRILISAKV